MIGKMDTMRLRLLLKANGIYLLVGSCLLLLGMLFGIITPKGTEPIANDPLTASLEQWVQFYVPYSPLTILFLFAKNALTAGISFFLAPILVIPPGVLLLNGYVLGFYGSAIAEQQSLLLAFEALAPHGIFEIPALIFAAAGGLRFGIALYRKIARSIKNIDYSIRSEFMGALQLFLISLALLLVAAVMETYVTPFVLGYVPR
jgi:stage II sporulation protein M